RCSSVKMPEFNEFKACSPAALFRKPILGNFAAPDCCARAVSGRRRAAEKCDELTPPHANPDLCGCQSIRCRTPSLKQSLHCEARGARCGVGVMARREGAPPAALHCYGFL